MPILLLLAARSHSRRDRWIDVYTFTPFGERVFLATSVPNARIASSDILTIFPSTDAFHTPAQGMLELPKKAYSEFLEINSRNQQRYENLWNAWTAVR